MLAFYYRFHGHGSLRFVYKNGRAVRSRTLTVKQVTNPRRKTSRCAVVVSKKVHKSAVGRNRIRRRLYEQVRRELPKLHGVYDIVLIVTSSEILHQPHTEVEKTVYELFSQLNLYSAPEK